MAALLVWRHVAFWQQLDKGRLEQIDRGYFRAQLRRRLQTSIAIGIVGLGILASNWIAGPVVMLLYLVGLVLLVCWILMMAVMDLLSTQGYLRHLRIVHRKQRIEMENEIKRLRKIRRSGGNGQKTD